MELFIIVYGVVTYGLAAVAGIKLMDLHKYNQMNRNISNIQYDK